MLPADKRLNTEREASKFNRGIDLTALVNGDKSQPREESSSIPENRPLENRRAESHRRNGGIDRIAR